MLAYNLLVFIAALLLYLDYLVYEYRVSLNYGGSNISLGNSFLYLALTVIIVFAGFRFEIGYDYPKYLAGYLYDDELRHWEPFFNFFVRLSRYINFGLGIQGMLLFFSAVTILILYRALRVLTPYYRLGILLYILTPSLYLNTFSTIRQGIAMVILLYGLQYITKNINYKKSAIVALIAFIFHYASIFVVLVYVIGAHIFQRTFSWIIYTFLIAISFILYFVHIGKYVLLAIPGHFSVYAGYEIKVSFLKLLIINLFFIFFLIQKDQFVKSRLDSYLFNSVFAGLLIFNIFSDYIYVSRLAQYFLLVEIVMVPIYLYSIKDRFSHTIILVLFLIYYLFNFDYALYRDQQFLEGKSNALMPYRNYFFEKHKTEREQSLNAWYDFILKYDGKEEILK